MYAVTNNNSVVGIFNDYPPQACVPVNGRVVTCIEYTAPYNSATHEAVAPASPHTAPRQYQIRDDGTVIRNFLILPLTLLSVKDSKKSEVTSLRNNKELEGFTFGGVRYDTKSTSLQNINGMLSRLLISDAFPDGFQGWIAEDNTTVQMSVEVFKKFAVTACDYIAMLYAVSRHHKDNIDALGTVREVLDYDVAVGW